jgi:hypothetical protein
MKMYQMIIITFIVSFIGSMQLASSTAEAKPLYRIAVIDTGFRPMAYDKTGMKLCPNGHYDFATGKAEVGDDTAAHGSYVTYLINKTAQTKNICFMIYKVFGGKAKIEDLTRAMKYASQYGAKAINLSVNVFGFEHNFHRAFRGLAHNGIKMFVAAGNQNRSLNDFCNLYPPCFNDVKRNVYIVGASDQFHLKEHYSNYGARVSVYDWGTIKDAHGTSFATPRALGRYIKSLNLDKK